MDNREVTQLGGGGEEPQEVITVYPLFSRHTSTTGDTRGVGRVLGLMRALRRFRPGCSLRGKLWLLLVTRDLTRTRCSTFPRKEVMNLRFLSK